jgi:adenylyl- and sulfurtransferase ThiI
VSSSRGASLCAIVHYHEISLKGGNRPLFLRYLQQNLLRATGDLGPVRVIQLPGRIMLDLPGHPDPHAVYDRLGRVSGIANFALAQRIPSSLDAMKHAVERALAGKSFRSFRITARRAFKTFPQSSVELNRVLGAIQLGHQPDKNTARTELSQLVNGHPSDPARLGLLNALPPGESFSPLITGVKSIAPITFRTNGTNAQ